MWFHSVMFKIFPQDLIFYSSLSKYNSLVDLPTITSQDFAVLFNFYQTNIFCLYTQGNLLAFLVSNSKAWYFICIFIVDTL